MGLGEQGVRRELEGQGRALGRGADCTPEKREARGCTGCPGRSTLLCVDRKGAQLAPPKLISLWGYEMPFLGRFIYALWPAAVGCDGFRILLFCCFGKFSYTKILTFSNY